MKRVYDTLRRAENQVDKLIENMKKKGRWPSRANEERSKNEPDAVSTERTEDAVLNLSYRQQWDFFRCLKEEEATGAIDLFKNHKMTVRITYTENKVSKQVQIINMTFPNSKIYIPARAISDECSKMWYEQMQLEHQFEHPPSLTIAYGDQTRYYIAPDLLDTVGDAQIPFVPL